MPARFKLKDEAKAFLGELLIYGGLVTGYCLLVLRYFGGWLADLFRHERRWYAVVAIALMVGQGFVLAKITSWILGLVRWVRKRVG